MLKHLKKFENLELLKKWGKLQSDENFKKMAEEFDALVEVFLDYVDEGYEIDFDTAYGTRVFISYEDYLEKNDKYEEFIHGLASHNMEFTSRIVMDYNYDKFLNILRDIQSSCDKIQDINWKMIEFTVNGLNEPGFGRRRIIISHEFKKII